MRPVVHDPHCAGRARTCRMTGILDRRFNAYHFEIDFEDFGEAIDVLSKSRRKILSLVWLGIA